MRFVDDLASRRHKAGTRAAPVLAVAGLAATAGSLGLLAPLAAGASPAGRPGASHEATSALLLRIEKDLEAEPKVTFAGTYEGVGSGNTTTFAYYQKPPDWLFTGTESSTPVEILRIGSNVYECDLSARPPTCAEQSSDPLGSTAFGLFAGLALQTIELYVSLSKDGQALSVTSSSPTIAGQASSCATISLNGTHTEVCVTDARGVLAYEGTAGLKQGTLLGHYFPSVSSRLFVLPKGAKIVSRSSS